MTITNRDLFYRDPTETKILNDGFAQVGRPETDQQWSVLRWELHSFVCEGQYARGLERILDSFLTNLNRAQQSGWRSCRCSSTAPACLRSTLWRASRSGPARTTTSVPSARR